MPAILTYALLSVPLIGAYAIFALGISVIYRSSRVLNLAHGAMAMTPAYLMYSMVKAGIPTLIALPIGILSGSLLGIGVERLFVRRLRSQGPTAQTVGTVAVTGLLIALVAKIWGTTPRITPSIFPDGVINLGRSGIRYGDVGLFITGAIVAAVLFAFFSRTQYGLAMRGAAQNRRAASLMGIDPDLAASTAWALGGGLAALGGILLASVTLLDPYTLSLQVLPAFVAALIGGLESLPGAIGGSAIAGLSFGLVPYFSGTPIVGSVARLSGSPQLALTILALVVLGIRGRRISGAESDQGGLGGGGSGSFKSARKTPKPQIVTALVALALLWPYLVPFSVLGSSLLAIRNALVAISLVVMTGWIGQISLGQASFVGISALLTGMLARGFSLGFPINLLVAAGVAATAGAVVGVVALRVRGLYLAVATMIFAWMTDAFLFKTPWMGASSGSSTIPDQRVGLEGGFPTLDLTSRTALFYVMIVVLGIVVLAMSNLRDTKTGRAFFAVRGSEMAAASLGIDVMRYKLIAFAASGALAGLAGGLLMIEQRTVVPNQFVFTVSLQFLAIGVVGGLTSLGGAIAAGALFAGLEEVFFQVPALSGWLEVVSAGLLTFVLLAYPGGLAALANPIRNLSHRIKRSFQEGVAISAQGPYTDDSTTDLSDAEVSTEPDDDKVYDVVTRIGGAVEALFRKISGIFKSSESGNPAADDWYVDLTAESEPGAHENGQGEVNQVVDAEIVETPEGGHIKSLLSEDRVARRSSGVDALTVRNVTVRFGGLTAVDDASLTVKEGTVTGLIGPNGAGKTTCFNAILGLNDPADGEVHVRGVNATQFPPHLRAQLGVARTFQVLQLFSDLSVFDNLLVATHLHNNSGIWSNMSAAPTTLDAERVARARAKSILELLDLSEYAHRPVRGLPFGVLRMVELGRALVTGARLVMLDEPASGLNEAETDRLSSVLRDMKNLGVSVLLIEHDIRMVIGVCDYLYVLDRGKMIANGPPSEIQRDPNVIAAYLGEPDEEEVEV